MNRRTFIRAAGGMAFLGAQKGLADAQPSPAPSPEQVDVETASSDTRPAKFEAQHVAEWDRFLERPGDARIQGLGCPYDEEFAKAAELLSAAPKKSLMAVYEYFQGLSSIVNADGEPYNSRWGHRANPLVVWFHKFCEPEKTDDMDPWCAAFLSWALDRVGLVGQRSASSQRYLDLGVEAKTPEKGDIAVFTHFLDRKHGHVALLVDYDDGLLGRVKVIGANQSGGIAGKSNASWVCTQTYKKFGWLHKIISTKSLEPAKIGIGIDPTVWQCPKGTLY